jgi:hypothetical protein
MFKNMNSELELLMEIKQSKHNFLSIISQNLKKLGTQNILVNY